MMATESYNARISDDTRVDNMQDRSDNDDESEADGRPGPESATTSQSSNPPSLTGTNDPETSNPPKRLTTDDLRSERTTSSIRSRPSRRSTIENGQDHSEKAEATAIEHEEERGLIRRVPFYRHPVSDAERWHDNADVPSQWNPFFYGMY